jgi:tetratricopeptide (TPR) repeat protein
MRIAPRPAVACFALLALGVFSAHATGMPDPTFTRGSFRPPDRRIVIGGGRTSTRDALAEIARRRTLAATDRERAFLALARSEVFAERKMPEQALSAIAEAVRLAPDEVTLWKRFALLHAQVGLLDQARDALDRAAVLAPRDPEVRHMRASLIDVPTVER